MRARLRFDPGRLWRHGHALICNLEERLNLWLPHKEDYPMSVKFFLIDNSREIFELFAHLLIKKTKEDLILQAESAYLLQHIAGSLLEIDPI